MPWCVPIPMITSGANPTATPLIISVSAQDYDLFAAAGSPATPVDLDVTLNSGVTIDTMTANGFQPGTRIFFTVLGTIRGRGGNGGNGGDAEASGPAALKGSNGTDGGHAFFSSAGIELFLDIDAGNAWGGGGGGGGGGGAATFTPIDDQGGGGGGGGQGWNTTTGGTGGTADTSPGGNGGNGDATGPGSGGSPGGGGAGGAWGINGTFGTAGAGSWDTVKAGGTGGTRGRAFLLTGGASLTLTGAKDLATLESEGRIKGGAVAA